VRVFADVNVSGCKRARLRPERSMRPCEARADVPRCCPAEHAAHAVRPLVLASEFRDHIPSAHVHAFRADERYVSPDDPDSNYRMTKETLLDHVACPVANVHPMPTHFPSADAAARDYETTLRTYFGTDWPHLD
jgi:hypothetical protein